MLASSLDQEKQDATLREIISRVEQRGVSKRLLRRLIHIAETKGGYPAIRESKRLRYETLYERAIKEHTMIHRIMCGKKDRRSIRCGTEAKVCTARDRMVRLHYAYCLALAEQSAPGKLVYVLLPRKVRTLNQVVGHLIDNIGLSREEVALLRVRLARGAPKFAPSDLLDSAYKAVSTAYSAYRKTARRRKQNDPVPPRKIIKKKKTAPTHL